MKTKTITTERIQAMLLGLILGIIMIGCSKSITTYQGDYFSLAIGGSWSVEEVEMPDKAQTVTLQHKDINNTVEYGAMLMAFNKNIIPEYLVFSQIIGGNEMFKGGDFEEINDCVFLGIESVKTLNYTNMIRGRFYYCKIYCFVKDDITFFFTTYQLSKDDISTFDEVWTGFIFNDVVPKSNVNIIDEIQTTITTVNPIIQSNNGVHMGDYIYMIGVDLSDDNNCITYMYDIRYGWESWIGFDFPDEVKEKRKQSMLDELIKDGDNIELIRNAMSQNITFKYKYYLDFNRFNRFLYEIVLTPEDYNNYQKY